MRRVVNRHPGLWADSLRNGTDAAALERLKMRLRCEARPASRNEAQSEVNTARPMLVRLGTQRRQGGKSANRLWNGLAIRLCIQGFVGLLFWLVVQCC